MQALEMDQEDLAPLVTRHGHISPRMFHAAIPMSRTTPQRQCLALWMVGLGMLFSTVMVYNLVNHAPSPWTMAAPRGLPLNAIINNRNRTNTTSIGNNRTRM